MKFFIRCLCDGKPTGSWNLIATKRWCLSWHRREPKCRVGAYFLGARCGLWAGLNLPLIGDFSVWHYASPGPSREQVEDAIETGAYL